MTLKDGCDFINMMSGEVCLLWVIQQFPDATRIEVQDLMLRLCRSGYVERLGGLLKNPRFKLTESGKIFADTGKDRRVQKKEQDEKLIIQTMAGMCPARECHIVGKVPFASGKVHKILVDLEYRGMVVKENLDKKRVVYDVTDIGLEYAKVSRAKMVPELLRMFYTTVVPRYPKYLVYHWSLRKCAEEDNRNAQLKRAA